MQRVFAVILAVGMLVDSVGQHLQVSLGCAATVPLLGRHQQIKQIFTKPVATKSTDKIDTDKLVLVQTQQSNKPASEPKK